MHENACENSLYECKVPTKILNSRNDESALRGQLVGVDHTKEHLHQRYVCLCIVTPIIEIRASIDFNAMALDYEHICTLLKNVEMPSLCLQLDN